MASEGDGGLEKHFIDLCNGLARLEHEVYALCLPKYHVALSDQVHCISIDLTGSRHNPLTSIKLLKSIQSIQPDIAHAQANKAGMILSKIIKKLACKTVVTIHNIKNDLNFLKRFDMAIGVSRGVVSHFPRFCRGAVVYNGVQLPDLSVGQSDFSLDLPVNTLEKTTLLSIGRLVPAKGFDLLIEACKSIDCYLLIAGDGPEKSRLQSMISANGLADKVFLLGHRDNIHSLITLSDLIVISSRKEGFSYVFSEALLLRKPVVATDVPVANEVLPNEYIAEIDANSLKETLQSILKKKTKLSEIFEPMFQYAQDNFAFESQVQRTLDEYEILLQ